MEVANPPKNVSTFTFLTMVYTHKNPLRKKKESTAKNPAGTSPNAKGALIVPNILNALTYGYPIETLNEWPKITNKVLSTLRPSNNFKFSFPAPVESTSFMKLW